MEEDADTEIIAPWKGWDGGVVSGYALRYEPGVLLELGGAAKGVFAGYARGWVKKQIISRTVLATLSAAMWPLGLLKAAKVVDNPFSVALRRSAVAGVGLAGVLLGGGVGGRPVTLAGFSMGGRVVVECCRELYRRGEFGVVENVVIIGAPVGVEEEVWREVRSVVAGRVVNVFAERDWVLAFLYRAGGLRVGVAGLREVGVWGVENVDVGGRVDGHLGYRWAVPGIMREVLGGDLVVSEVGEDEVVMGEVKEEVGKEEEDVGEKEFEEKVEEVERELKEKQEKREKEESQSKEVKP